jgi:hypothetical protein
MVHVVFALKASTDYSVVECFHDLSQQVSYLQHLFSILRHLAEKWMEQHAFKSVNNCLNTNIYSYLETSGGQVLIYVQMLFIFSTPV